MDTGTCFLMCANLAISIPSYRNGYGSTSLVFIDVVCSCEEVEEERARVGGDAVVLCLWLNVEPVRLRGDQNMRCAASGLRGWFLELCEMDR